MQSNIIPVQILKQVDQGRFWSKIRRGKADDCWPWTASFRGKYGCVMFHKRPRIAHRIIYLLTHPTIDQTLCVLHKCDNPSCCNPNHMFLGTKVDNINDAIRKGRWRNPSPKPGSKNPMSILTEYEVLQIRRIHKLGGISQRELAKAYGVNFRTINYILSRKLWKHI